MHRVSGDILLVEDNPHDIEITLHTFRILNIPNRIDVVRDGEEALKYIFREGQYAQSDHNIALILLDVKLPKLTGIEVLKQIKSDNRTKLIPVVMLSASSHEQDVSKSYDLGANSYIIKPVEFDVFEKTVRDLTVYWLHHNQSAYP